MLTVGTEVVFGRPNGKMRIGNIVKVNRVSYKIEHTKDVSSDNSLKVINNGSTYRVSMTLVKEWKQTSNSDDNSIEESDRGLNPPEWKIRRLREIRKKDHEALKHWQQEAEEARNAFVTLVKLIGTAETDEQIQKLKDLSKQSTYLSIKEMNHHQQ